MAVFEPAAEADVEHRRLADYDFALGIGGAA
jgi:hypothetical protein